MSEAISEKLNAWAKFLMPIVLALITAGLSIYAATERLDEKLKHLERNQEEMRLHLRQIEADVTAVRVGMARVEGQIGKKSHEDRN